MAAGRCPLLPGRGFGWKRLGLPLTFAVGRIRSLERSYLPKIYRFSVRARFRLLDRAVLFLAMAFAEERIRAPVLE